MVPKTVPRKRAPITSKNVDCSPQKADLPTDVSTQKVDLDETFRPRKRRILKIDTQKFENKENIPFEEKKEAVQPTLKPRKPLEEIKERPIP